MRSIRILGTFVVSAVIGATTAFAQPTDLARFDDAGYYPNVFYNLANAGFARVDLDGDGVDDLALSARAGTNQYLAVIGRTPNGSIQFKQTMRLPEEDGELIRVLAYVENGRPRVLTVGMGGACRIYGGWPLALIGQYSVSPYVSGAAVGDLDADGVPELVVSTTTTTLAIHALDGQLRHVLPYGGPSDIALDQLDADPALEIVLNNGYVLDGATHAVEWHYAEGFGGHVATGKVVPDGSTGWIGTTPNNHFTIFRAAPWSPLWSGDLMGPWAAALTILPIDGGGMDGVAVAESGWGGVAVYDMALRQLRYRIHEWTLYVLGLTGVDIDGDTLPDLAVGTGGVPYPGGALTIHDARNGATKWEYVPTGGALQAMVWGDADGDGKEELTASGTIGDETNYVTIAYDAESGLPLWRAPFPSNSSMPAVPRHGRHISLSTDTLAANRRIVLAGSDFQEAQITVLDGVTRAIVWAVRGPAIEELRARAVKGLVVSDIDADGAEDVIVATQPANITVQGTQLLVFSGRNGTLLRRTDLPAAAIQDALLIQGDESGASPDRVVISTPTQLLAYDLQTGTPAWNLDVEHQHVVHVRRGLAGAEIFTFSESGEIRIFDATTRQPLRQLSLGEPIRQARVIDDDVGSIALALERRLVLLDGTTGTVRATSSDVGRISSETHSLAVAPAGAGTWRAAISSSSGIYRFRIRLTDALFKGTFDPN
ncbi:MAG: hypothetical protein DI564_05775 [Rhodanobacter denitrificans]|uniref:VCBS repeat-containing protein n=1 Tax=Rhodanobacter denitrificans TaxID=666685 RepID=A0A2W5MUG8_9GAMM|nr:MAG: hypothetical protein DI564_05775 [Rhodanobacter denitrificans]